MGKKTMHQQIVTYLARNTPSENLTRHKYSVKHRLYAVVNYVLFNDVSQDVDFHQPTDHV